MKGVSQSISIFNLGSVNCCRCVHGERRNNTRRKNESKGWSPESVLEVSPNLTAPLGGGVYLSCRYRGQSEILSAQWKRRVSSRSKAKRLAGFSNGKAFSRDDFSPPSSLTNLTVQMKVSSVAAEGEYVCEFQSEEEDFFESVFVTVVARPEVQTLVQAETVNNTHYQTARCSAVGGRPTARISWLVGGLPPSDHLFAVNTSEAPQSDGTSTLSSALTFPTHLQDQDSLLCLVHHPALAQPQLAAVRVETFARPNVTVEAEMVQVGGSDFWVVSCISSGGRPDASISLALNATLERETEAASDLQRVSVYLPLTEYEGHNVTCVFDHPKFTQRESRAVTLPPLYLSGAQIQSEGRSGAEDFADGDFVELQEGQTGAVISLQLAGNVPRYTVICNKDGGPLPGSVELVGRSLIVQGPVEAEHAGLYQCSASYHHLNATLHILVSVQPIATQLAPPTIHVGLRREDGRWVIECSAADAVPAANMSWLPPEGVSRDVWFNSTSHNGSFSVRGVLLLPACSPRQLTAECVINHPAFEEPENRSVTLPLCTRPNISVALSTEWSDGRRYLTADCSADSGAPAAEISWHAGNSGVIGRQLESEVRADGLVRARSSVHFLSSLYAGRNLTCVVKHPSREAPEKRSVHVPVQKAPLLSVSVEPQQHSPLWLAVCDCSGEGTGSNLTWVLPENAKSHTSLSVESDGNVLKARRTYEFPLALHEGQNLTCVYQLEDVVTLQKTVHVPKYYISYVRVLNRTTPLQSRYGGEPLLHRLSLQDNHHNQKILLQVEGNVPEYQLACARSDGSLVPVDGTAMILQWKPAGERAVLYTCSASFYHHSASVSIEVEVRREDEELFLLTLICISSASALVLVLAVVLCVCRRSSRKHSQRKESLSAFACLMHEPGSPEVKKPAAAGKDGNEQAHLISYSIVIDVKSRV
ncbi:uncharacterized protein LOC115399947 isoform X2 [Salarias fasciatus]|uniref:uncharacterized protein LOC115399947 isoform X2 n=1 Tax=Salarias fasciatus TaxID=181472 RepID=UPI001176DD2B|nr:uncharacterized protein LOC115399947 isoform X2 [Salarias fasciatus]